MDTLNSANKNIKFYSLDYARGVAVLLVATGHFFDLHPSSYEQLNFIRRSISFSGLPIFFVLSGFLLTRQMTFYEDKYRETGKFKLWIIFFVNRILRIYPAYIFAVVALGIIYSHSLVDISVHILNIHNFFSDYILSINPVYWTLAVEFQWYLAFPVLFALFSIKRTVFKNILLLFLLFISGFAWRQYLICRFLGGIIDSYRLFMLGHCQLISHLFAFCLGIVLLHFFMKKKDAGMRSGNWSLLIGIVFCFMGGLLTLRGMYHLSELSGIPLNLGTLFFIPFGAAVLLYWMLRNEDKFYGPGKYITAFVRWIGMISYSLYLWHYPIFNMLNKISGYPVVEFIASFSAAIALSWVSYFFIEKRFLAIKGVFLSRLSVQEGFQSSRKP
jgi:peptidoglycan/LPS O-acetylase OafA/YrhL